MIKTEKPSIEGENSKKAINEQTTTEAKISKKVIKTVLSYHKLEVRDIEISPDGKFLISCSEYEENENPYLVVWNLDQLLEGDTTPEISLQAEKKVNKYTKITNWLLCTDSTIVEIGGAKWWVICSGSIIGDIYLWSFRLARDSRKWDFKNYNTVILSGDNGNSEKYPKAIFDIKIQKEKSQENLIHIYFVLNNIHTTIWKEKTDDNTINKVDVSLDSSGNFSKIDDIKVIGIKDVWITKLMIKRDSKEEILITGSKDGKVNLWNIAANAESILIGEHDGAVTDISLINNGKMIASSSTDTKITIWEQDYTKKFHKKIDLLGHTESVLSIEVQIDNKYLFSASKDNTIKIWDLNNFDWIRSIDMHHYLEEYEKNTNNIGQTVIVKGLDFIRNIKITPDNRYIFISKYNKIIILRNFGIVWHFIQQLKFVKQRDPELYRKIYGNNLKQIAKNSSENEESLNYIYNVLKKRLIKNRKFELEGKTEQKIDYYNMRELGNLFIPLFMKSEQELKAQKEFILGTKQNYEAYWYSTRNSIFKLPDIPWGFNLYITTSEMSDSIEDSNFVEITDQTGEIPYIILDDRSQTQLRFLMVLNNVQTNFIPLINNISIDIEDDRGDKDTLVFSDFTYTKNFLRILTNPTRSLEKIKKITEPEFIYYADCTFQIDEGYCVEDFANIFIRKITVEYTETLEPSESTTSNEEDFKIFEAFRKNFIYPLTPKTKIQIGKGLKSKLGKMIDEYFTKIIIIEFILSFWGIIYTGLESMNLNQNMLDMISRIVNVASIILIVIILIMIMVQSRRGKKREIDIKELDEKMRKRRRKKFGK